ncbi:hypothetical protein AYO22_01761 [Fonsecaea multimorphosa]|nr:hypothetical protein AYO22_01761 [Fonsecaea multimorphosa]
MAPPSSPEEDLSQLHQQRRFSDYHTFLHNSTLAALFLAPALIALPPRKLDLYTFSLTGAFVAAANYQLRERTGLGFMGHASRPFLHNRLRNGMEEGAGSTATGATQRLPGFEHAPLPDMARESNGTSSTLRDKAQEDWKQRRLKEEQEKLEQGEGYGSMIVDQIWEVWNQGEKKVEELEERDEEAVQKQRDRG